METHKLDRMAVGRTRRPPGPLTEILALHESAPDLSIVPFGSRVELSIEATAADGSLAPWLDDDWWTTVLGRWPDRGVNIQIAPTPEAILHPILLYQLEMVRRVATEWCVIGYAHLVELQAEDALQQAARSPYHEIRVIDPELDLPTGASSEPVPVIERLFDSIREKQVALGVCQPRLVRLAPDALPEKLTALTSHA